MGVIENAVNWIIGIANDNTHGYDQGSRWSPNYDCSSLVISAWQQAGVPVRTNGATYTGNMKSAFLRTGFQVVTDGTLRAGDVLLNEQNHTAMYIGNGKIVQASLNERGGVTGGISGDQTGKEIAVVPYYNYPWDCVLRYTGGNSGGASPTPPSNTTQPDAPQRPSATCIATLPILRSGDNGMAVRAMQGALKARGCSFPVYGTDGDFGSETKSAVVTFQRGAGLTADGVVGQRTWEAIFKA